MNETNNIHHATRHMNTDALTSPSLGDTTTTPINGRSNTMSKGMQMGIFVMMLGASAGMTLYTRKTDSMIRQMEKIRRFRRFPTKYGPMTKEEWEKVKPRYDNDDGFF